MTCGAGPKKVTNEKWTHGRGGGADEYEMNIKSCLKWISAPRILKENI